VFTVSTPSPSFFYLRYWLFFAMNVAFIQDTAARLLRDDAGQAGIRAAGAPASPPLSIAPKGTAMRFACRAFRYAALFFRHAASHVSLFESLMLIFSATVGFAREFADMVLSSMPATRSRLFVHHMRFSRPRFSLPRAMMSPPSCLLSSLCRECDYFDITHTCHTTI